MVQTNLRQEMVYLAPTEPVKQVVSKQLLNEILVMKRKQCRAYDYFKSYYINHQKQGAEGKLTHTQNYLMLESHRGSILYTQTNQYKAAKALGQSILGYDFHETVLPMKKISFSPSSLGRMYIIFEAQSMCSLFQRLRI